MDELYGCRHGQPAEFQRPAPRALRSGSLKRFLRLVGFTLSLLAFCGLPASALEQSPRASARNHDATAASGAAIDIDQASYVFEAWGTNINVLAGGLYEAQSKMDPALFSEVKKKVVQYLFDPTVGIGLNAVRAFASAGQKPEIRDLYKAPQFPRPSIYWNFYDSWLSQDGTWRTDADPIGLSILSGAKAYGANVFELRAQGAPWWMTVSQNAAGNGDEPNLDPTRYKEYTDYIAGVARRLTDLGYRISSVSAFEEASSPPQRKKRAGSGVANDYSPNDFLPATNEDKSPQFDVIHQLRLSLNQVALQTAKVAAPNEASPRESAKVLSQYPPDAFKDLGVIGSHGYVAKIGNGNQRLRALADQYGKSIEITEDDWGRAARQSGSGNTWPVAIRNAEKIVSFLRDLRIVRWYVWNPGPRIVWFGSDGAISFGTQFHMLKFIVHAFPAGIRILPVDDPAAIAGVRNSPGGKEVRIVVVNASDQTQAHSFTFSRNPEGFPFSVQTITEGSMEAPASTDGTAEGKTVGVAVPPQGMALISFRVAQ